MLFGELLLNKSAFTGEEIVNPLIDTGGEKTEKILSHLYHFFAPAPAGWYASKIIAAASGELDAAGRQNSVPEAIMSMFGIKYKERDIDMGKRFKRIGLGKVKQELSAEQRQARRALQRKQIDKDEYKSRIDEIKEKRDRLRERYKKIA